MIEESKAFVHVQHREGDVVYRYENVEKPMCVFVHRQVSRMIYNLQFKGDIHYGEEQI